MSIRKVLIEKPLGIRVEPTSPTCLSVPYAIVALTTHWQGFRSVDGYGKGGFCKECDEQTKANFIEGGLQADDGLVLGETQSLIRCWLGV